MCRPCSDTMLMTAVQGPQIFILMICNPTIAEFWVWSRLNLFFSCIMLSVHVFTEQFLIVLDLLHFITLIGGTLSHKRVTVNTLFCYAYMALTALCIQSTLDISNSDISNFAKLKASIWNKNTFLLLSTTIIRRWRLFYKSKLPEVQINLHFG